MVKQAQTILGVVDHFVVLARKGLNLCYCVIGWFCFTDSSN